MLSIFNNKNRISLKLFSFESALFQCRVTAGVPSPSIEWRRSDGSLFTTSTELMDGVIRFNRVTGDEDGTYICTVGHI